MKTITNTVGTLHQHIFESFRIRQGYNSFILNCLIAITASVAIWISAKIQIPFYPVPITMQTFVILILGMLLGRRLGVASVGLYLIQGALGLPVFAGSPEKGLGLVYMLGPTGGYLLGFFLAVFVVAFLAERGWDRKFLTTALAMLLGNFIIYASGLLWLGALVGWDKPILAWGFTPFLLGDALKIALATLMMPFLWKFLGKISSEEKKLD